MRLFKNISLQHLWQSSINTFLRFPFVLLSAIVGTTTVILLTELENNETEEHAWLIKLVLISGLGIILFFTLELIAIRYRLLQQKRLILWLGGLVFLVAYYILLPKDMELSQIIRFLSIILMLHLAASYAMFLNVRQENAFWQFNKTLFLRILTSILYSGVLFIGMVVAIVALDQLFSVAINEEIYYQLWIFMVGIFNTWFFLAGVPTNVEALEQTHTYPKGLKIFTQFVLLPLVTVYLLILYAYFGKIVVRWEWPEGWVSILILCFSIAGILSLLLIHPIRNEVGNTWIRSFSKWFYRALFPLIILFVLAIWRRISEYGITEERYVVLALAFWLFITVLFFLLSKSKNIKFIPVTLSLVALISVFSPVNMFIVSEWSQVSRLRVLLEEHGIMKDEKVYPSHQPIAEEAEVEISSIIEYLSEYHGFEELENWFTTDLEATLDSAVEDESNKWVSKIEKREKVLSMMGVEYSTVTKASVNSHFNFLLNEHDLKGEVQRIKGYDFMVELGFWKDEDRHEVKLEKKLLIVSLRDSVVYFQLEQETLKFDLMPVIKKLMKQKGTVVQNRAAMTYNLSGKNTRIQVVIQELYGKKDDKEIKIDELRLLLLVGIE